MSRRCPYYPLLISFIAAACYYIFVARYATNVPVGDDYSEGLGFLLNFLDSPWFVDRVKILLAFFSEHRIVTWRVCVLLSYYFFGEADFYLLTLVANATLTVIAFQVARIVGMRQRVALAVTCLILFQPQPTKLMFYPMAHIQAYGAIIFSLWYIESIVKGKSLLLPLVPYVLAMLTTGGGVFLILLGVPALVYQGKTRAWMTHVLIAIPLLVWYFHDLPPIQATAALSETSMGRLCFLSAVFFVHLLGSSAEVLRFSSITTLLLGAVFCVYLLSLIRSRLFATDLLKFLLFAYLVLTIALVAVGRVDLGYGYRDIQIVSLDGRYRIYSNLFFCAVLLTLPQQFPVLTEKLNYKRLVLYVAAVFCVYSYSLGLARAANSAKVRAYGMSQWLLKGDSALLQTWAVPLDEGISYLSRAIDRGIYKPRVVEDEHIN